MLIGCNEICFAFPRRGKQKLSSVIKITLWSFEQGAGNCIVNEAVPLIERGRDCYFGLFSKVNSKHSKGIFLHGNSNQIN